MDEALKLRRFLSGLGFRVVYVDHSIIAEHIACYNVVYRGVHVTTRAAEKLSVPLNEIWVSKLYRRFEKYILFHELREIMYRARGMGAREAHLKAQRDEEMVFGEDPQWRMFVREVNIAPEKVLMGVRGVGRVLARRIISNRPYASLDEVKRVRGVGEKRMRAIKRSLWCISQPSLDIYLWRLGEGETE